MKTSSSYIFSSWTRQMIDINSIKQCYTMGRLTDFLGACGNSYFISKMSKKKSRYPYQYRQLEHCRLITESIAQLRHRTPYRLNTTGD